MPHSLCVRTQQVHVLMFIFSFVLIGVACLDEPGLGGRSAAYRELRVRVRACMRACMFVCCFCLVRVVSSLPNALHTAVTGFVVALCKKAYTYLCVSHVPLHVCIWWLRQMLMGTSISAYEQPILAKGGGVCADKQMDYSPMSQPCANDWAKTGLYSKDNSVSRMEVRCFWISVACILECR